MNRFQIDTWSRVRYGHDDSTTTLSHEIEGRDVLNAREVAYKVTPPTTYGCYQEK